MAAVHPEMLPWAQKVFDERRATSLRDDPEARCMPQGVPKASTLPYPFEIVNAEQQDLDPVRNVFSAPPNLHRRPRAS